MQFFTKFFPSLSQNSKYGGEGIFFFLVEEAQVKNKIGRIVSSYEDNGEIDTTVP